MGAPDGLVEWMRARLAEDEAAARDWQDSHSVQFPSLVDPARALAEVAAHRAILAEYEGWGRVSAYSHNPTRQGQAEVAMGLLATVIAHLGAAYADREGYQEVWRP